MTDNEIVKALECCINRNCKECPMIDKEECDFDKFTLDLINRLQAENDNLKDILYDADGVNLVNYWHQQCKIAENGCKNFGEENKNLKAEVERLQTLNSKLEPEVYRKGLL